MTFTFEKQGTNTYLVYKIKDEDSLDSMGLGMLTNNKITGLAPTFFTQMDTTKYIKYNVSSKVSVKQFFSGYVNKKRLTRVFNSIVEGLLSAEDYMLDIDFIILDLEYIFADVSTCQASLICLPIVETGATQTSVGEFFKNIMFNTQFDQNENCDYVARIINFLNSSPVFSLSEFKAILDEISSDKEKPKIKVQTVQQPRVTPIQEGIASSAKMSPPAPSTNKRPVSSPAFNAPAAPQVKTTRSAPETTNQGEKKMTLLRLLMSYNKENAALYKAQKASKKGEKKSSTKAQKERQPNSSFNVPGTPDSKAQILTPTTQTKTKPQPITQPKEPSVAQTHKKPAPKRVDPTVGQQPSPHKPQGRPVNFGETTVLGGGSMGETTVLNASQQTQAATPYLFREKNNEKILIDKPVFRIGKERSYVDYFIGDNTAISRSHANFIIRDENYYVVDTNSTNNTFVNNVMIQSNVETQINHDDKIKLADEVFVFKLY